MSGKRLFHRSLSGVRMDVWLKSLMKENSQDDCDRCALILALVCSSWQLSGPCFSAQPPSFAIVGREEQLGAALRAISGPASNVIPSGSSSELRTSGEVIEGFLKARQARARLAESGEDLAREQRTFQRLMEGYRRPQGCAHLDEAKDSTLGWISLPDGYLTAWAREGDAGRLLTLFRKSRQRLFSEPIGVDPTGLLKTKILSLNATLSPQEWSREWCELVIANRIPMLFIPYVSVAIWSEDCFRFFSDFIFFFGNDYRVMQLRRPNLVACLTPALGCYARLISQIAGNFGYGYFFWVHELIYELLNVVGHLADFVTPPGQRICDNLILWLMEHCLRGLAYSVGSLNFHGVGVGTTWQRKDLCLRALKFVRENGPISRAKLSRRFHHFRKKETRDEMLKSLAEMNLISVERNIVTSVSWEEFILGLPQRLNFPPLLPSDQDVSNRWRDIRHPLVDLDFSNLGWQRLGK